MDKKLKMIAITSTVFISLAGVGYVNFGNEFFNTVDSESYVDDGSYLVDDYENSLIILNSINENYSNIENLKNTNLSYIYRNSLKNFDVSIDGKYNNKSNILYDLSMSIDGKVKFKDYEMKKKSNSFIHYDEGVYDKGNLSINLNDKIYELSSGEIVKDLNSTEEYNHRNYLYYETKNLYNFYTNIPSLMEDLASLINEMKKSQAVEYNSDFGTEYIDYSDGRSALYIKTAKENHKIIFSYDYFIEIYSITNVESGEEIYYNIFKD